MAAEREFEGATLQEALGRASAALGIPEPDLHFEILDTGRRGLFGLGAKSVRVRVEPLDEEATPERPPRTQPERREPERVADTRRAAGAREPERGTETRGAAGERAPERGGAETREPTGERGPRRSRGRGRGRREKPKRGEARVPKQTEQQAPKPRAEARPPEKRKAAPAASPETLAMLESTVRRMLELMDLDLTTRVEQADGGIRLELEGEDTKRLLEKDAELLLALQFLLNRMARRAWPGAGRIQLSCDGYRGRRDQEIVELAKEVAGQVASTGQTKRLEPMNPYERRLVHITVREFPELSSRSEGNGFLKRICISKK